jgi:hypothetical protein
MSPTWYPVYKVKYTIALRDPDMPPGRFHHAIFVENKNDGSGTIYHVTGDITSRHGMSYQSKKAKDPEESRTFIPGNCLATLTLTTTRRGGIRSLVPYPLHPNRKPQTQRSKGKSSLSSRKSATMNTYSTARAKSDNLSGNALSG